MSDLSEFLAARLDEDEAIARAATASPWVVGRTYEDGEHYGSHVAAMGPEKRMLLTMATGYVRSKHVATAEHITRHDPARVLREVEAGRKILALIASYQADDPGMAPWNPEDQYLMDAAIRALAAVWSDHADYDPAWADPGRRLAAN